MNHVDNKAVFLSYASQDAAAVERIAAALRAVEVGATILGKRSDYLLSMLP